MESASRPLTASEIELARTMFGDAIDYGRARVANRKWAFFHSKRYIMAPTGTIHFHPADPNYCDDFGCASLHRQGLFLHEMTHIWQYQKGIYLPLARHPFCRYGYSLRPGWGLERYGLEQQAEIVRHMFLLGRGVHLAGAPPIDQYRGILPFTGRTA